MTSTGVRFKDRASVKPPNPAPAITTRGRATVQSYTPGIAPAVAAALPRRASGADRVFSGAGLDWLVLAGATWIVAGAHLDSWAHNHIAATLESFFTPWHALLYSGMAATTTYLLAAAAHQRRVSGRPWGRALPDGYLVSLLGCAVFGLSGAGDLAWHLSFGIERGIAALFSPTHLGLGAGAALIAAGPLRAAWRRPGQRATYVAVLSATLLLSLFTFFSQYDHPYVQQWAQGFPPAGVRAEDAEVLGMMPILLQTAILMGLVLLLVQRWRLPPGSLALLLLLNGMLVTSINHFDPIFLLAGLAGLAGDGLLAWLRPGVERTLQVRLFAAALPLILYSLYFAALARVDGLWWPVHFWSGAIVLAGITGWLVSWLVFPPRRPAFAAGA